jgi:hydrogenase nickel incorporation protein HypB
MCRVCGCEISGWHQHSDGHWHTHDQDHEHDHIHTHEPEHVTHHHSHSNEISLKSSNPELKLKEKKTIETRLSVLARNDQIGQSNREWLLKNKIFCINLMSSPGSGKTLLLEKILGHLSEKYKICVLVGDQATSLDAERLENKGAKVKQINTHNSCHLDAPHIEAELNSFVTPEMDLLIIENVGNLVCPTMFDLGEAAQVALLSSPEGEEKPTKYPVLFSKAQLVLITKMDLEPYLNWSLEKTKSQIRRLNAMVPIIPTSAQTGLGLDLVIGWIEEQFDKIKMQG